MRSFAGRDILSLKDFERNEFFHLFEIADRLEPIARERRNTDLLAHKTLVTAFYQPSTRTRLAHEAAMHRLGGHVLGFSDAKMTRAGDFYQESIKDTVHMLEYYGDVLVMRHFQQGAPHEAAHWASIPVINAGDGWGEHPTQVLTDDADFLGISMGDQTSWLRVQQSPVPFTTDGRLLNPARVQLSGSWSIRRVCQMLPHGYQPF